MKDNVIALLAGMTFAVGLCVARMVNPRVIIDFLDVTGRWDPGLGFVMAGALAVTVVLFRPILKKGKPLCAREFCLPEKNNIDKPLVLGAVLFGIGWGACGICPGPAAAILAFGLPKAFVFFFAMMTGMVLYQWTQARR